MPLEIALRSDILNQPRAHLPGLPADVIDDLQARLPNLTDVREEAKIAVKMLEEPPPTDLMCIDMTQPNNGTQVLGVLHPSIAYQYLLPNLYVFSYFCHEEDVPEDLLHLCLWALEQRLIAVTEGSDEQLQSILRHNGTVQPYARALMTTMTRTKIINYLISARINRPEDALSHVECRLKAAESAANGLLRRDAFLRDPELYALYGEILSRTRSRDPQAKAVTERILRDINQVKDGSKIMYIQAKLYLSRVLRRIGDVENAKKHEEYLIKWFKKNHRLVSDHILRRWFETEIDVRDPVLEGLGGKKWFNEKRNVPTFKTLDRSTRACYRCGVAESLEVKMMRCTKCQYTFYCSKKCQVEDHPSHKLSCQENAAEIQRAEALKGVSPQDSKCIQDWNLYKNSIFDNNACCNALGLKFKPDRGKTHIVIRRVEYVPPTIRKKKKKGSSSGSDILDRFRIVEAGVFRITDVLGDVDRYMGYNPGESREVLDEMIDGFEDRGKVDRGLVPFFMLYVSNDRRIVSYLSLGSVSTTKLREMKYNPDWRRLLNRKQQWDVKPLSLPSGARDVEFDYTPEETEGREKEEVDVDATFAGSPDCEPSFGQAEDPEDIEAETLQSGGEPVDKDQKDLGLPGASPVLPALEPVSPVVPPPPNVSYKMLVLVVPLLWGSLRFMGYF